MNRTSGPMPATITLYSRDGAVLASSKLTLAGNETREMDIQALLAQDNAETDNTEHQLGGVSIGFTRDFIRLSTESPTAITDRPSLALSPEIPRSILLRQRL